MAALRKPRKPADEIDPLVADLVEALARAAARRDIAEERRQKAESTEP